MKRLLIILALSFFWCNTSSAGYGSGELIMSEKSVRGFQKYLQGKEGKPVRFLISEDGLTIHWWYCPYSNCTPGGDTQEAKICSRRASTPCHTFAVGRSVKWKNTTNPGGKAASFSSKQTNKFDLEEIKRKLQDLGFYNVSAAEKKVNKKEKKKEVKKKKNTKSDPPEDFQIEGISIGDSLLDYVSKEVIEANKKNYYGWVKKNKNKFSASEFSDSKKFPTYDAMQFSYKTDDPKYIIHDLVGLIDFKKNIQDCYEEKEKIEKELRNLFSGLRKTGYDKKKHEADSSGKSYISASNYWFSGNSHMIGIKCTDWSKKMKYTDHLRIQIKTKEFNDWLNNK